MTCSLMSIAKDNGKGDIMERQSSFLIKILAYSFALTLFIACNDEKTVFETIEVEAETAATEVGDDVTGVLAIQCESELLDFNGISEISDISQRTAKIHWLKSSGAATYSIFLEVDGESKYQGTQRSNKSFFTLKNLTANTTYRVFVRMMDHSGKVDSNNVIEEFTTLPWPEYENTHSVDFNGNQVVELPNSNKILNGQKITISTWFKTNQTQNDKRLISLKKNNSQSALNIHIDNNSVNLGYRDNNSDYKKLEWNMDYDDNEWHHVAATYNKKFFRLYVDGVKVAEIQDSFLGLGPVPAMIGGYKAGSNTFKGNLDEVSFWNTNLNDEHITEIFGQAVSSDLIQHSKWKNLKAWYRFSENVYDEVNSHTGNPVGFNGSTYDLNTI